MHRYSRLKLAAIAIIVLVAAASAVAWRSVAAQPAEDPKGSLRKPSNAAELSALVPGGPGFYAISAFEFTPPITNWAWLYEGPELCANTEPRTFDAPVSLPNGATVTKLIVYFWDSSAHDLTLTLYGLPFDGSAVEHMAVASASSSTGYGFAESTEIFSPVIDQQANAYYVEVFFPSGGCDLRLRGVRIDYTYQTNLPVVTNQY
jgi:hypothetical protein